MRALLLGCGTIGEERLRCREMFGRRHCGGGVVVMRLRRWRHAVVGGEHFCTADRLYWLLGGGESLVTLCVVSGCDVLMFHFEAGVVDEFEKKSSARNPYNLMFQLTLCQQSSLAL